MYLNEGINAFKLRELRYEKQYQNRIEHKENLTDTEDSKKIEEKQRKEISLASVSG